LATTPVGPLSVYKLGWTWDQAPAAMTAFNLLKATAPNGLSDRIGLDLKGTAPSANNPVALSVNAIGQWFGTPGELGFLLAPVIAVATPTSQVIESLSL
jgi:hypothetical protein